MNKKKIADFEKGIWKSIKIVWMIICNTRNETVLNETKRNETKRNKQKLKETYINETKQFYFVIFYKWKIVFSGLPILPILFLYLNTVTVTTGAYEP